MSFDVLRMRALGFAIINLRAGLRLCLDIGSLKERIDTQRVKRGQGRIIRAATAAHELLRAQLRDRFLRRESISGNHVGVSVFNERIQLSPADESVECDVGHDVSLWAGIFTRVIFRVAFFLSSFLFICCGRLVFYFVFILASGTTYVARTLQLATRQSPKDAQKASPWKGISQKLGHSWNVFTTLYRHVVTILNVLVIKALSFPSLPLSLSLSLFAEFCQRKVDPRLVREPVIKTCLASGSQYTATDTNWNR